MSKNIIFLHLPKNGGSTLHSILDRLYFSNESHTLKVFENPNSDKFLDHIKIPEFKILSFAERAKIRLLKGHMVFGLHEYLEGSSKYITFLRKPEERIISYYYYVLRKPKHRLYKLVNDNKMSLLDFVLNCEHWDINNAQVRLISGIDDKEEIMLEKALENIKQYFRFIGTQELFDESLILLSKELNWGTPFYQKMNSTKNRITFDSLDSKTQNAILEMNKSDRLLYEQVTQKLELQIKKHTSMNYDTRYLKFINQLYTRTSFFRKVRNKIDKMTS